MAQKYPNAEADGVRDLSPATCFQLPLANKENRDIFVRICWVQTSLLLDLQGASSQALVSMPYQRLGCPLGALSAIMHHH